MAAPLITISLAVQGISAGGTGGYEDITAAVSQETSPSLRTAIEDPTGTNSFLAPDVTLKGYDQSGHIQSLLYQVGPLTKTAILITAYAGAVQDVLFSGFVAQNTIRLDPREKSFSFTSIGYGRALQTTSAESLFIRITDPRQVWYLVQGVTPLDKFAPTIRVANQIVGDSYPSSYIGCPFQKGDTIQIMGNETFTVVNVYPDPPPSANPPVWNIVLGSAPKNNYPANTTVVPTPDAPVTLVTKYQRNVKLSDAVSTLFGAAGLPVANYYSAAALPNLAGLFASPINSGGLPEPPSGIMPDLSGGLPSAIIAGTSQGVYASPDPESPFTLQSSGIKGGVIDGTNYSATFGFSGIKRSKQRTSGPRFGLNITFRFYGYDFLSGNKRYILTVTCDTDVDGFVFGFTTKLESETYAAFAWGGTTLIANLENGSTTTDLGSLYDALGIDVDPLTGTVFFTDITNVSGAGSAVTINISSYNVGPGLVRNRATKVNGPVVITSPGRAAIFQVDGILGKDPTVYVYSLASSGAMALLTSAPITPAIIGRSVKKNGGDGRYYGLISDPVSGIFLRSWAGESFVTDAAHPDMLLLPPPPNPSQSNELIGRPYEVDLIVLKQSTFGSTWPMVGLFGGVGMLISNKGAGVIEYMDMTGLSVADALQQLTILNAGVFYLAPGLLWDFHTRNVPKPGNTIGASDVIDDTQMTSLVVQPVFNRWAGYVKVSNENDDTIYGEAGDPTFANADGLSLTLTSRFVTSKTFAAALAQSLYNYLGSQKRWIEVEHLRDGRIYEIGRTFRCTVDGAVRNFMIIETDLPLFGQSVKVVGLEY